MDALGNSINKTILGHEFVHVQDRSFMEEESRCLGDQKQPTQDGCALGLSPFFPGSKSDGNHYYGRGALVV